VRRRGALVNRKPSVLIVDHDPEMQDAAPRALAPLGYDVITKADGVEALGELQARPTISALLVDVMLQGPLAAAQLAVRARTLRPKLRVIFTTSYPEMFVLDREAPHRGRLVRKSWDLRELAAALDEERAAEPS